MKLSRIFALAVVGSSALATSAYVSGCSSDSTSSAAGNVGGPPAKPSGPATTSMDVATFAVDTLLLGEADRSGAVSPTAWKSLGYNLDGKVTTQSSTDVCTLAPGAGKSVQVDGNNGIDNSFGANILPIIQNAAGLQTPSKTISDAIAKGSFTIMLSITGLTQDAKQTNTSLTGQLFAGGAYDPMGMTKPTFDMNTDWPVRPELLNDGMTIASGSKVKFSDAYIVNGTFVNGTGAQITLSLGFGGVALDLTVKNAILTFDHAGAAANNGTIGGVIDTEQLITGLKAVAGRISPSLCSGTTFDGIASQIKAASDILSDGTNAPGTPCTGISIGIGFTAKQIKNPDKVAPMSTPSPDPCSAMDGGVMDSGGGDSGLGADTGAGDGG